MYLETPAQHEERGRTTNRPQYRNGGQISPEKLQTDTESIHQLEKATQRDEAGPRNIKEKEKEIKDLPLSSLATGWGQAMHKEGVTPLF